MRDIDIQRKLIGHTILNSGFDSHRNYLGLSQLYRCNREIWNAFFEGRDCDTIGKLKCYKGYQMEADLMRRLSACFDDAEAGSSHVVKAYDGLVQGHPDFYLKGKPGDFKSLLFDRYLPNHYKEIPYKVLKQIQAYMMYLPASMGYVIFESRESGDIRVFSIPGNSYIQNQIKEQVDILVKAVQDRELPFCACKNCAAN